MKDLTLIENNIREKIYTIRGHKIILDFVSPDLYGVHLKTLRQAVTGNRKYFPPDFQFQLTSMEWTEFTIPTAIIINTCTKENSDGVH